MIVFPNAKINIGLQITEKRADGFHNLISCFYPVPWKDVLEIIEATDTSFQSSGISIPDDPNGNLCLRAYELLKNDYDLPPVSIHLHKVIPIGAGLGGGSADAAFTLSLLNDQFKLGLHTHQLEAYARKLGSDCAFFIQNKPVLAIEKGDVFQDISLDLSGYHLTMIYPNLHISTKEAYSGVCPKAPILDLKETLENYSVSEWKAYVVNDFEKNICLHHPELNKLKASLYESGAAYVAMTGSGSTFFALSQKKLAYLPPNTYSVFTTLLK